MLESGVNRLSEGLFRFSHALQRAIAVPNKDFVDNLGLRSEAGCPQRKFVYAELASMCQLRVAGGGTTEKHMGRR